MAREVLSCQEARAADLAAVRSGVASADLMRRAGSGVARVAAARYERGPVLVLCGPGSNGGDGFVIARRLHEAGFSVRTAALPTNPDAADALAARAALGLPVTPLGEARPAPGELVIDAIFGAGLSRDVAGEAHQALDAVRGGEGVRVVAVDLPTGVQGDTGAAADGALRADLTVTFHRKKPGHLLTPGRDYCGEVVVIDIGLPPPTRAMTFENDDELWGEAYPRPGTDAYKGTRGRLMVVSGPALRTGAARLAARAGLRAGAGLVTVLSPPGAALVHAVALEAVMLASFRTPEALAALAADASAVVIGPAAGVGAPVREAVGALKARGRTLVVDADAITSFKDAPEALFDLLTPFDVLTPHVGEFERLFPGLLKASGDRLSAARAAARRSGAVVVLKGPDTVVAAPDGRASINAHASPFLATAGSGDVLAGLVGGLLAQGLEAFLAASAAVYLHGDAGLRGGPGLIAEDLPELLVRSQRRLYARRGWRVRAPI